MIGENENVEIWDNNIFNAIKDVSDIGMQKLAWLGKHPVYISSFTEVIATLYDDFDFERYIKYYESIKGKDKLYKLLLELNEMINKYKVHGYEVELEPKGDEMILSDPQWIEITNKAKEIYQAAPAFRNLTETCGKFKDGEMAGNMRLPRQRVCPALPACLYPLPVPGLPKVTRHR